MGNRYIFEITCPKCNFHDNDAYYAPTCGFIDWTCPACEYIVDLEKYTGISAKDASSVKEIELLSDLLKTDMCDDCDGTNNLSCNKCLGS